MKVTIYEHLDNDPTYRGLVDERNRVGTVLGLNNRQRFPISEAQRPKYEAFLERWLELSNRISAYERASIKPDLDDDLQRTAEIETIVPIVIDTNEELKRYFSKHPEALYDLHPRKFEILIADILKDLGFEVSLTQATHDRGIDIYAYLKSRVGTFLTFVECKRWEPQKHVGIEVVQRLYGVQQANQANKSMIVTTSFFTQPAIIESKRYEHLMELKDYDNLKEWLNSYQ